MKSFFISLLFFPIVFVAFSSEAHSEKLKYRVSVMSAKIFPTKSSGKCWDVGCFFRRRTKKRLRMTSIALSKVFGIAAWKATIAAAGINLAASASYLPDPNVDLRVDGKLVLRTGRFKNSLTPIWQKSRIAYLNKNSTIRIYVYDRDIKDDDAIGVKAITKIPAYYLSRGGVMNLRFGRVYNLKLLIKPIKPTATNRFDPKSENLYYFDNKRTFAKVYKMINRLPLAKRRAVLKNFESKISIVKSMKIQFELFPNGSSKIRMSILKNGKTVMKKGKGKWHLSNKRLYLKFRRNDDSTRKSLLRLRCTVHDTHLRCILFGKNKMKLHFTKW